MKSLSSPSEAFSLLNEAGIDYLVLRNFENLADSKAFLLEGHPDIDILCRDSQAIVRILDAQTTRKDTPPFKGDGIHYFIYVGEKKVSLDLRYVGDGYYCQSWEEDMLARKESHGNFFVMCPEDYFYSLVYHAILQKNELSQEYRVRLTEMAARINVLLEDADMPSFLAVLQHFMKEKGYLFEYTKDQTVPCRFWLVNPTMILPNRKLKFRHWVFDTKVYLIQKLVDLKHALLG